MNFKNKKITGTAAVLMAVAVMLSAAACGKSSAVPAGVPAGIPGGTARPQKAVSIAVNVTYPERETLSRKTEFAGKIEASQAVKVYPEVSGTVAKTYVNAGDTVNKGDLLFEFDPADAELALKKAELAYQKTINSIESEESGSAYALNELKYKNSIESAQNNYESRREDLEFATEEDFDLAEFKRVRKKLWDTEQAYDAKQSTENWTAYVAALEDYNELLDDYASYTNFKNQITAFESAYTSYLKALEEYDIYKSMTSGENEATREINRAQAELTLADAQKAVANQKVYAPVSGIISAKNINEYDNASAQTAAYIILQEGTPTVSFSLSEDGANAMDIGTEVSVYYNNKYYSAEVIELAPEANSSTGLYPAKAQLTEDIGTNRSGAVIKVQAITALEENTLTVSLDNIYYDGNQPYVYVYDNGTARRVDVTVGMTTTDKVSVTDGLSDDDAIITTWHPKLADGVAVSNPELDKTAAN